MGIFISMYCDKLHGYTKQLGIVWLAYLYSNNNVTMNYVETVPVVNLDILILLLDPLQVSQAIAKDYINPGKLVYIYYERVIVWNVALSLSL